MSRPNPPAIVLLILATAGGAGAFDIEPADPTRCDAIVLAITRTFSSNCGWSATAQVDLSDDIISVSLEAHAASEICLPVVIDETFRVPIGAFPPGEYVLSVSWNDLDRPPDQQAIRISDAACPPPILRGDANLDGSVDLADPIRLLFHLFAGGEPPPCPPAADADADGSLALPDAVFLLDHLFLADVAPSPLSEAEAESCAAGR